MLRPRFLYKPELYVHNATHVGGHFTRVGTCRVATQEFPQYQRVLHWRGPFWRLSHQPFVDLERALRRIR